MKKKNLENILKKPFKCELHFNENNNDDDNDEKNQFRMICK